MPARNVIKQYTEDAYYHVYNRGVEKRAIFQDDQDYTVFLNLLKRHLSGKTQSDKRGTPYETYEGKLELLAYSLMTNHFHLLFYLSQDATSVTKLMRRVAGAYTTYFNKKYRRVGHLFQGVYKCSKITNEAYLHHISRYIHLNARDYKAWPYSSYPYYRGKYKSDWVMPGKVLQLFDNDVRSYEQFMVDYLDHKNMLDELKHELADM